MPITVQYVDNYHIQSAEYGKFVQIPISSLTAANPTLNPNFHKYAVLSYQVNGISDGLTQPTGNPNSSDVNRLVNITAGQALSAVWTPHSATTGAIVYIELGSGVRATLDGITNTSGVGIMLSGGTTYYFNITELQKFRATTISLTGLMQILPYA